MKKLAKWISVLIFALIIVISVGIMIILAVFSSSMGRKIEPDFVGYKSTIPLNGAVITDTDIRLGSTSFGGEVFPPTYSQSYDSGVVLVQSKASSSSPVACESPVTPQAEAVLEYKCQAGDLQDGTGSYAVSTVYKADELISIYVSAKIGDTYMSLNIPEDQEAGLSEYTDWQNYFNSMQPVDLATR